MPRESAWFMWQGCLMRPRLFQERFLILTSMELLFYLCVSLCVCTGSDGNEHTCYPDPGCCIDELSGALTIMYPKKLILICPAESVHRIQHWWNLSPVSSSCSCCWFLSTSLSSLTDWNWQIINCSFFSVPIQEPIFHISFCPALTLSSNITNPQQL